MRTFDWNEGEPVSREPQVCDATLAEGTPVTVEQAVEWVRTLREVGVRHFEVPAERDLVHALQEFGGLIVSGAPGPLLRDPLAGVRFRWAPEVEGPPPKSEGETACQLKDAGYEVTLVIREAVSKDPVTLSRWVLAAREWGLHSVELTATQGAPWLPGIRSLVEFVTGLGQTELAWSSDHGFGLALCQAMEAWRLGVGRIRATFLGLGARGNVPLELLLVNLDMEGAWKHPLVGLNGLCQYGTALWDLEIAQDYPAFGGDAFRTASGMHAAAILKAMEQGDRELADLVYSSISAARLGREQVIEVGPMSGRANLQHWLERNGLVYDDRAVQSMLSGVQRSQGVLSDLELYELYVSTGRQK